MKKRQRALPTQLTAKAAHRSRDIVGWPRPPFSVQADRYWLDRIPDQAGHEILQGDMQLFVLSPEALEQLQSESHQELDLVFMVSPPMRIHCNWCARTAPVSCPWLELISDDRRVRS